MKEYLTTAMVGIEFYVLITIFIHFQISCLFMGTDRVMVILSRSHIQMLLHELTFFSCEKLENNWYSKSF